MSPKWSSETEAGGLSSASDMANEVTIDDRQARALFREFPKIANAEINKGYRSVASDFMGDFSKTALSRAGVYRVRRKGNVKPPPRGQPRLPKKARLAGFKATIGGTNRLDRKSLSIRTRNPLLLIREEGGVIVPRRKEYLTPKFRKRGRGGGLTFRKVRSITVRPVLRFESTWRSKSPPIVKRRLQKSISETVRRAERQVARSGRPR